MTVKEKKINLIDKNREDIYRRIIQETLNEQGKTVEDLRWDFKRDFEFYNFRDFMCKKKNQCSLTFFENIMKKLKRKVIVEITVEKI